MGLSYGSASQQSSWIEVHAVFKNGMKKYDISWETTSIIVFLQRDYRASFDYRAINLDYCASFESLSIFIVGILS